MPYVRVHIDASEVLEDIDDDDLRRELQVRSSRRKVNVGETSAITREQAKITLDESAHRLRQIERFDLAFKLDEIRSDYF